MRFDELDLEDAVLDGLYDMNFEETTPVQALTIPIILEGKDIGVRLANHQRAEPLQLPQRRG